MEEKDNMKKNEKRPVYEPPKAVDLSDSSVSGRQLCGNGDADAEGCMLGANYNISPTNS